MAIDFPNSPSVNDLYTAGGKTWQWNGTYWAAYGTGPVLRTSDTAPVSPNNGDLWYETDTGRFFTYYDSAWVEIGNATDIAGALQPGQVTALSAVTSLTSDDVFPVIDNPSSATAANKITYGNLVTAMSASLAPGLVLVKTQAVGSGVTSVDVTSCFSSAYENYKVTYTNGSGSTTGLITLQFLSGSTPSTTGYHGGAAWINVGGGTWQLAADNNTSQWNYAGGTASTYAFASFELLQPFLAKQTVGNGTFSQLDNGRTGQCFLHHTVATSYDGLRFGVSAGTLTGGTIRVYGYRN